MRKRKLEDLLREGIDSGCCLSCGIELPSDFDLEIHYRKYREVELQGYYCLECEKEEKSP